MVTIAVMDNISHSFFQRKRHIQLLFATPKHLHKLFKIRTMKEMKYEEAVRQLETIVDKMERGELDVDSMAAQLKQAQELVKLCKQKLKHTDDEIQKLLGDQ